MSIFYAIIVIVLLILLLPLVLAAFMADEYNIEREITINKPGPEVFDYLKLLKNQVRYNKWMMADPGVKMEYQGTDGTIGFVSAWDSDDKQVGKGGQEIKKISPGERIDCEIRFIKPMKSTAVTSMTTTSVSGEQTKVKWHISGMRNYTMKLMYLMLSLKKYSALTFRPASST